MFADTQGNLLAALTENLNPAIQLNGTKNAQFASPGGS